MSIISKDIDISDKFFFIKLCKEGLADKVKMVLENFKVDIDLRDHEGNTALIYASTNGHTEIVKLLLAANADVDNYDNNKCTSLHVASFKGHVEIVKLLLTAKADVNAQDNVEDTALIISSIFGYPGIVKLLLAADADVNIRSVFGNEALSCASMNGHAEVVKLLEEHSSKCVKISRSDILDALKTTGEIVLYNKDGVKFIMV